jgi:hypothetical protein
VLTGHKIRVTGARHRYRAHCECGWRSKPRPTRGEAVQDGSMHKLEAKYGGSDGVSAV